MPRAIIVLLTFCVAMLAQSGGTFEIRGTVFELGSDGSPNIPVAGAEVTLSEFVLVDNNMTRSLTSTAYTDPRGAYQFHPQHKGDYYVEVKKEGYAGAAIGFSEFVGNRASVDDAHPTVEQSFTITRRGELTGRIIDEDGEPIADLKVTVQPTGSNAPGFLETTVTTAMDGTFTATGLLPGPHVVRISSRAGELEKIEPHYSVDDLKIVDQDLETTYWPGGTADPTASIPVSPGATASVGTIKIRQTPYYRVHVSVPRVECAAGEKWNFAALDAKGSPLGVLPRGPRQIPCTNDFLVSNLRPGLYSFMLRKDEAPGKWALASVNIADKNVEVELNLEPDSQILGRVIAAEGAILPPANKVTLYDRAEIGFSAITPVIPDAEGKFVLKNLKFPRHQIVLMQLTAPYYVKEMRFNGEPVLDAYVTLNSGEANQLEIVIDDKAGVISGTVMDGDKPATEAMVRLFPKVAQLSNPVGGARTDAQGKFQIAGLAPGDYRIIAVPFAAAGLDSVEAVQQLAVRAETVRVERGGTQTVTLTLTDPSR